MRRSRSRAPPSAQGHRGAWLKDEEFAVGEDAVRDLIRYYTARPGFGRWSANWPVWPARPCAVSWSTRIVPYWSRRQSFGLCRGAQVPPWRRRGEHQIGAVTGLAWTEVGGELLTIESVTVPGKGMVKTTGKLARS